MHTQTYTQLELLPVQIRQASDKHTVIRKAMEECPSICRDSPRLTHLAELLGLSDKTDVAKIKDAAARTLLSELEGGDAESDKLLLEKATAYVMELIGEGYASVWDLCENLASSEGFSIKDDQTRLSMARFALIHCDANAMDRLLLLCARLQCKVDAGEGTLELARKGAWDAFAEWSKGTDGTDAWGTPALKTGVVRHAFYSVKKPLSGECLSDPYWTVHKSAVRANVDDEEEDLYSLAAQARLTEGLTVLKVARILQNSAGNNSKDLVDYNAVLQRVALSAAYADVHTMLAALCGVKLPSEVAAVVSGIMRSHARSSKEVVKRIDATARLAAIVCWVLEQCAKGAKVPENVDHDVWERAIIATTTSGPSSDSSTPLGQIMANAVKEVSTNPSESWPALRKYYEALPQALVAAANPDMVWTLYALCDATADVASLVDGTVEISNVDGVCAAAEKLRGVLGGDAHGPLSAAGVRARLVVKILRADGSDMLAKARVLLRDIPCSSRLWAAQELIAGGGVVGDVCVAVLETVTAGVDEKDKDALEASVRKLRAQADTAYKQRVAQEWDAAQRILRDAGVPTQGLPNPEDSEDALCDYVCAHSPSVSSDQQIRALAAFSCLWDASLSTCLHALTSGELGQAPASPPPHSADLPGGSVKGYAAERPPAHGPRLWGTLCLRAAELRFGTLAVELCMGPARGRIGADFVKRVAQRLSDAGLRAHAVHCELLEAGEDALPRLCEVGYEDEGVRALAETCARLGYVNRVPQSGFARVLPKLLGRTYPGVGEYHEHSVLKMSYMVMPEKGGRYVTVRPNVGESLAIAVAQVCIRVCVCARARLCVCVCKHFVMLECKHWLHSSTTKWRCGVCQLWRVVCHCGCADVCAYIYVCSWYSLALHHHQKLAWVCMHLYS
jgi:hypothetical protein